MAGDTWVIDTTVIAATNNTSGTHFWDAMTLLMNIEKNQMVAVDHNCAIFKEYEPYMPIGSFARQWWIQLNTKGKVWFYSSRVPNSVRRELIDILKFDCDDLKFVGVANNTSSKRLVSQDSDYNPDVVSCLRGRLNIIFYDIPTACLNCQ